MEIIAEMGITKICMMARMTKMGNKTDEVWTVIPAKGEAIRESRIMKGDRQWDAHEYLRTKETEKMEVGQMSWASGT